MGREGVMIIGQLELCKSQMAGRIGEITHLPVIHIGQIDWSAGWVKRSRNENDRLRAEIHARPEWIFEGEHSST